MFLRRLQLSLGDGQTPGSEPGVICAERSKMQKSLSEEFALFVKKKIKKQTNVSRNLMYLPFHLSQQTFP